MKRSNVYVILTCLMLTAFWAGAVEPSYVGRLGNPEEPALRPYKWLWHGLESLVYYTADSIQHGNSKTPVLGMSELGRGLRKGAVELGESTCRGILFTPIPPKDKARRFGQANEVIEARTEYRETADFLFSGPAYPVMKLTVDLYPATGGRDQHGPQQKSELGGIELKDFPQPPHGVMDSPLSDFPAHCACGCIYCARQKQNAPSAPEK